MFTITQTPQHKQTFSHSTDEGRNFLPPLPVMLEFYIIQKAV